MAACLTAAVTAHVLAGDYEVAGADTGLFGKATSIETTTYGGAFDREQNIDRSKDAAITPPPFGSFSSGSAVGDIPILPTQLYNAVTDGTAEYPVPAAQESLPHSNNWSPTRFTSADILLKADGSIGTLTIPCLDVTAKVYDGESLKNLAIGIGHFASTSCWDGNVGLAAHNRSGYFGKIHTLKAGDRIIYSTKLGTRVYEVFYVGQISETDFSILNGTNTNILTLITCVKDVRDQRVCVQACEVAYITVSAV